MDVKSKRRVLLADDFRDTVQSLSLFLEAAGCEVQVCESGREVLQRALEFRPLFAVLDLDYGSGPTGVEVIAQLRAHPDLEGLLIAAVTGWTRAADRDAAVAAGCDHFFVKPADPDELLQLLLSIDRRRDRNVQPLIERRAEVSDPGVDPPLPDDEARRQG